MAGIADDELARMAEAQDGIFTTEMARSVGLSREQIDRRAALMWRRVHEGVFRLPGAPPTRRTELRARFTPPVLTRASRIGPPRVSTRCPALGMISSR
jgi:hypothetical protein